MLNPALVAMLGYSSAEEVLKLSVAQDVFSEPEEGLRLLLPRSTDMNKNRISGRSKITFFPELYPVKLDFAPPAPDN